jgi:hypothetical protein
VVLAIGHALRAHEALGHTDALSGFLEVVHRLFEDGVFVGHDRSIRVGSILRSLDCFAFSRWHPYTFRDAMLKLLLAETLPYATWCCPHNRVEKTFTLSSRLLCPCLVCPTSFWPFRPIYY